MALVKFKKMGRGYIKRAATVNFTIHELKVPEQYPDEFHVKWKRGNFNGMTESGIVNDNNSVIFEKRCQCKVTMYISKKDNSMKEKEISIKVYRTRNGKDPKIFGELRLDISSGYGKSTIFNTYDLKSPHSKVSKLVISFDLIPDESATTDNLDSEMGSQADLFTQSDEKPEKWDISEAISPEDSERLKSFFNERAESLQRAQSSLNAFSSIPIQKMAKRGVRLPTPTESPPRKHKLSQIGHRTFSCPNLGPPIYNKDEEEPLPKLVSMDIPSSPIVNPEIKDVLSPTEISNLLKSILKKEWCTAPLPSNKIPLPSVIIYAAFLHTKLFQDQGLQSYEYNEIFLEFFNNYENSNIILNATSTDKFICTIYLLFLVKNIPGAIESRLTDAVIRMSEYCTGLMIEIVTPVLPMFESLIQNLVSGLLDQQQMAKEFKSMLTHAQGSLPNDEPAKVFFYNYLITAIDYKIVEYIASSPYECTFLSAIQWNSLNTILDEAEIHLPFFRQAAAILMMSAAICGEPSVSDEVCPNLPKLLVLKILANQQPDNDFNPMPNDVMQFISFYKLNGRQYSPQVYKYIGDFQDLREKCDIMKWKETEISSTIMESFTFLRRFFESK